ncbi:MAG: flagellar biosynthetic protein FliO [Solirubrobacteraceae bacterium]
MTRGVALGGALMLCCAPAASAAAPSGENTPLHLGSSAVHHASSSGSSSILRTLIALVVVVGIIYVVARILRAVKGRDAVRASGSGLEQIASLPLAPGKSVALVRSGRDIVLVGVGEQGVTPIKTYTEAEALAGGIEIPQPDDPYRQPDGRAAARATWMSTDRAVAYLRRLTVRS